MKTLEDKGDLKEVLPAAAQALEAVAGQLGVKTNDLQAPEMPGEPISQDDFEDTGNDPSQQEAPQQPPADPSMDPMMDPSLDSQAQEPTDAGAPAGIMNGMQ